MKSHGFYDKPPYKGRETAIAELERGTGGQRAGRHPSRQFLQIRGELSNGLQEIFANKGRCSRPWTRRSQRGNAILRRFEATYKGKQLP
jgi:sn-glycerol 3-phosphate transport system substrate-binding protein